MNLLDGCPAKLHNPNKESEQYMIQATHVYNNTNICILIPLGNQLHVTKHIFQMQCPCGGFFGPILFVSGFVGFFFPKQCSAFHWKNNTRCSETQLLPRNNDRVNNCRTFLMNVFQANHCHFKGLLFLFM